MLTDTHVHFDGLMQAGDTIGAIVARATMAGVNGMIAIGGSVAANRTALEIARAYPGRVRAAVGYDRHVGAFGAKWPLALRRGDLADAFGQAAESGEKSKHRTPRNAGQASNLSRVAREIEHPTSKAGSQAMAELEAMLAAPEVVAVGEIGLDFHHGHETAAAQIILFNRMLLLARDPDSPRGRDLPVCVHTRAAEAETLAALREHAAAWRGAPDRIGVMHCFTGGEVFARDLLALGFMISFSGIITFKNAGGLLAVAALVPDDRLLIETDSPYLAPEPFRGQPNEPARVRRVAETLATIRRTSWETIAELTARNAERLFGRS